MRYFCLACDYDGTLADEGMISSRALGALKRLKDSGRRSVLVTGRNLNELLQILPEESVFDRIVTDNGAVLYSPDTRDTKILAGPPPASFVDSLRERGVPLSVGHIIVATIEPYDATVLEVIKEHGLELQVIYNKGSVMILPSGVNKSTGLAAALAELSLSGHNTVGVGDAENDHALLNSCELGVAVANAIPTLKEQADLVTTLPAGAGVEELIDRLLYDDLKDVRPRRTDRQIILGSRADNGADFSIRPYGSSFVVAGPSGSGKTTFVRALIERIAGRGYQICLVDPEGDYDELEDFVALGSATRPPEFAEVFQVLQSPQNAVSINLMGVPVTNRPIYFGGIFSKIQDLRFRTGRPHWIIIDEAHHLIPKTWKSTVGVLSEKLCETILVTVHVDSVLPEALKSMSGIIAVGPSPEATLRQFSESIGFPLSVDEPLPYKKGVAFLWRVNQSDGIVPLRLVPPSDETRRHKRKYAQGELSPDRSFYFRGPKGKLNLRAQNLSTFVQIAEGIDDETWLYHLRRRDYSEWIGENIKDEELMAEVAEIENDRAASEKETRTRVTKAINRRYTGAK